jgi:hypothetical protein
VTPHEGPPGVVCIEARDFPDKRITLILKKRLKCLPFTSDQPRRFQVRHSPTLWINVTLWLLLRAGCLPPGEAGRLFMETSSELIRRATIGCSVQGVRYLAIVLAPVGDEEAASLGGLPVCGSKRTFLGADTHPVLAGLDGTRNSILVGYQPIIVREPPQTQVGGNE